MRVCPTEFSQQQQHSPKKGGGVSIHRDRGDHSSLPGSPFIVRSGADALRSHPAGSTAWTPPLRSCRAAALPRAAPSPNEAGRRACALGLGEGGS